MREFKHVGIYGGTFDPIHFGHINLALEIMEYHQLDEVWFCPANNNPHKQEIISATAEHRLAMLELALADLPDFGILPNELERPGPSYTIDTLKELVNEENETSYPSKFYLILGEDSVPGFYRWREPAEIIKLAPPLVGKRFFSEKSLELEGNPEITEALLKGMTPTRLMEISATQIRDRVRKGLYIGHLLPAKVAEYIGHNRLYI
jgi:nicotinate-nucleotide adenylyltransferase